NQVNVDQQPSCFTLTDEIFVAWRQLTKLCGLCLSGQFRLQNSDPNENAFIQLVQELSSLQMISLIGSRLEKSIETSLIKQMKRKAEQNPANQYHLELSYDE